MACVTYSYNASCLTTQKCVTDFFCCSAMLQPTIKWLVIFLSQEAIKGSQWIDVDYGFKPVYTMQKKRNNHVIPYKFKVYGK